MKAIEKLCRAGLHWFTGDRCYECKALRDAEAHERKREVRLAQMKAIYREGKKAQALAGK